MTASQSSVQGVSETIDIVPYLRIAQEVGWTELDPHNAEAFARFLIAARQMLAASPPTQQAEAGMNTTKIDTAADREAFERAMTDHGYHDFRWRPNIGGYHNLFTQDQWVAWQAARASAAPAPVVPADAAGAQVVRQTIIAHGLTVPAGFSILKLVERIGELMSENAALRAALTEGAAPAGDADGVDSCANTPYDEGPFTLSPLQVTVCELRDGDGLTYMAMLHHVWQEALDGMCVERRPDKAEVEAEAQEWREFLAHTPGVKTCSCRREAGEACMACNRENNNGR